LLAVSAIDGKTTIGRIDDASRRAIRESLFRAGELLRLNQIEPVAGAISSPEQLALFDAAS
ncbi:MAG: ATPase, partial [Kofleriaceae bacterium]|nr:ATPase [Kofleriaceae bacterium]